MNDKATIVKPIILGDWNEECTATSNSQQLCDEFGLIDVWASIHPGAEQVKTYLGGSRRIDLALSFPETAACITNIVYEPFHYRLCGDHRGLLIDFDEKWLFDRV